MLGRVKRAMLQGSRAGFQTAPVAVAKQHGRDVLLKIDLALRVRGVVHVAGWSTGDVELELVDSAGPIKCTWRTFPRADVSRTLGIPLENARGFSVSTTATGPLHFGWKGAKTGRRAPLRVEDRSVVADDELVTLGWLPSFRVGEEDLHNLSRLRQAGLVSASWYASEYSEVAEQPLDPTAHYYFFGATEGRKPNWLFDTRWYLEKNEDVRAVGMSPLVHYLLFGELEGRKPGPYFDPIHYRRAAGAGCGLAHYLAGGGKKFAANPFFDPVYYLETNADVRVADIDPLLHYITHGWKEGREPHPEFSFAAYGERFAGGRDGLSHYLEIGLREGVSLPRREGANVSSAVAKPDLTSNVARSAPPANGPLIEAPAHRTSLSEHPLFDSEFYLSHRETRHLSPSDAFQHFMEHGTRFDLDPHPCFASSWYRRRYRLDEGVSPWADYVQGGWKKGRQPNWLFSERYLRSSVANLPDNEAPLISYLKHHRTISPHALLDLAHVVRHYQMKQDDPYVSFWRESRKAWIRPTMYFDAQLVTTQVRRSSTYPGLLRDYILEFEAQGVWPNAFFDPSWYRQCGHADPTFDSCLEHFIEIGELTDCSPCLGFSPRDYWEYNPDVARAGVPSLRHMISSGHREGRRTHRLFDKSWYVSQNPEATGAPFLHYLNTGRLKHCSPHPAVRIDPRADAVAASEAIFRDVSRGTRQEAGLRCLLQAPHHGADSARFRTHDQLSAYERRARQIDLAEDEWRKRPEQIVRFFSRFDYELAAKVQNELEKQYHQIGNVPLVSVVLPTRDRAAVLGRAIESVLSQSHTNLELLIIDDGSIDGTTSLIRTRFDDQRIRLLTSNGRGVGAARNVGLEAARGDVIAYIDSDNYWEPGHLQVCLAAMLSQGFDVAYSALRVLRSDRVGGYRGDTFDLDALKRENYIDMNVFVHSASSTGTVRFDETLTRCVDWDFIVRLCKTNAATYVPVVGCNYVDDDGTLGRITTDALAGDFYRICTRELELGPHIQGQAPAGAPDVSVLLPIGAEAGPEDLAVVWDLAWFIAERGYELIICNNASTVEVSYALNELARRTPNVRVVNLWRTFQTFPALNLVRPLVRGRSILLWDPGVRFDARVADRLLGGPRRAVTFPLVVDREGGLAEAILEWEPSSTLMRDLLGAHPPPRRVNDFVGAFAAKGPAVLDVATLDERGGLDFALSSAFALVDYCFQCLEKDPESVAVVPDERVVRIKQLPAVLEKVINKEFETLRRKWIGRILGRSVVPTGLSVAGGQGRSFVTSNFRLRPGRGSSYVVKSRSAATARQICIRCPAPSTDERKWWGDYHFALAMARAFESLGIGAHVALRDDWDKPTSAAVALHLRGIVDVKPIPGVLNVVWLISHPDKVSLDELAGCDLVLVPSEKLRRTLRMRFGIESFVFPQATGIRPAAQGAVVDPVVRETALFIGNSRRQLRPIVLDALQQRLPISVYGREWEGMLPMGVLKGDYIPNEAIADWYEAARVVLNDHWPSMRHAAIASNRLFDVVASGGIAISDHIDGLSSLFDGHVRTYTDAPELAELMRHVGDWAPDERRRLEMRRIMHAEHSFGSRARTLLDIIGWAS